MIIKVNLLTIYSVSGTILINTSTLGVRYFQIFFSQTGNRLRERN